MSVLFLNFLKLVVYSWTCLVAIVLASRGLSIVYIYIKRFKQAFSQSCKNAFNLKIALIKAHILCVCARLLQSSAAEMKVKKKKKKIKLEGGDSDAGF